jgi:predicted nucleic acid-binding protein
LTVIDSGVWIDYFNGVVTPQTDRLHELLGLQDLATGDLMLAEVLRGCRSEREFRETKHLLTSVTVLPMGGTDLAIHAARNYRILRELGFTVRSTIDLLIATYCLEHGHSLLHSDRDFDPFAKHLGLRVIEC